MKSEKRQILLSNTLSKAKELYTPVKSTLFGKPVVGMYHCGPTVYDYPHIGNLRAYVFADTLKRVFLFSGYKVKQVINITDVGHLVSDGDDGEDKMEKARKREHKSAQEIADFYTGVFKENLRDLGVDTIGTKFTKATDHIKEQIALVKQLEKKGFTYRTSDGIYFDTSKFPQYGELGSIDIAGLREGERIGVNTEKRNPTDFALWKFSPVAADQKREQEWQSPWGVGFPGWHIECSAMAMKYLGQTIDIHTGGIDHIPVHHNNEIAQSEAATGRPFARYWMHTAFIQVDGAKMAKSAGTFITLADLKAKGFSPLAYRYLLLTAHYSSPMNFTWESLTAAQNAYNKLIEAVRAMPAGGKVDADLVEQARQYVANDMNTAEAIALVWEIIKNRDFAAADKKATLLKIDALLGIIASDTSSAEKTMTTVPIDVSTLATEREAARAAKDWKKSDELRDKIAALGFEVKDTADGQKISRLI